MEKQRSTTKERMQEVLMVLGVSILSIFSLAVENRKSF